MFRFSSDDEWSSSARSGYDRNYDDRRRRDYSPDDRGRREGGGYGGLAGRRSRSRDDLMELERGRRYGDGARGGRDDYDDSLLREAMERKRLGEQQRARSRERLDSESDRSDRGKAARGPPPLPLTPPSGFPGRRDDFPPPPPPPYSDSESVSSSKKSNLRKASNVMCVISDSRNEPISIWRGIKNQYSHVGRKELIFTVNFLRNDSYLPSTGHFESHHIRAFI